MVSRRLKTTLENKQCGDLVKTLPYAHEQRMAPLAGLLADLVPAIAASGLPGSMLLWPDRPLDDLCWCSLLSRANDHRLSGLLLKALDLQLLPVTAEQAVQAHRLHSQMMGRVLLCEAALLETAETFDRAGIVWRALNGAATAHLVYANPAQRPYRGINVLAPAAQFDDALEALALLGYKRSSPPLRPGFDGTFGTAVRLVRADGMAIALHRTLVPGPFGLTIQVMPLFQTSAVFCVGGKSIKALECEAHFLHSCYKAVLNPLPYSLIFLRDVTQQVLDDDVDAGRVLALARAWAGEAVLALAVRSAWERFALADAVLLSAWADRYISSKKERRFLAGYRTRRFAHEALDSLQVIKGVRSKAAFLRAVALPDPAWLAHHNVRRGHWLRRGGTAVLRHPRGWSATGIDDSQPPAGDGVTADLP
jgi:hypothetical protein